MGRIKYFSQRDPRWNRLLIGKTNLTIHNWGCLILLFCNAIQRIFGVFDITPIYALNMLRFTDDGKVIHKSMKFKGMEVQRIWKRPAHKIMTDFTNQKNKAVGVEMAYNPEHWLLVTGWTVWWKLWFLAADPLTYNPKTKTCRIVKKWKWNISGAFLFTNGH